MSFLQLLPVPTEGVKCVSTNVETRVGSTDMGKGTLYISEANITWISESTGNGFSLNYTDLVLHAVSRDHNLYPRDCLYILVNGTLDNGILNAQGDIGADDFDEPTTEIRLAPNEADSLEDLYKHLQECSLLHQGPDSDLSDEEENMDDEEGEEGGGLDGLEEEEDSDTERQNQFERMCLHFRPEFRNGSGGDPPPNEDPDQFEDAD